MAKDPYAVLGIRKGADAAAVKAAYRRLAKRYHPDLHPDDPVAARRMNAVNEAYEMIRTGRVPADEDPYAPAYESAAATADPYDRTAYGGARDYRGGEPEDEEDWEGDETDPWKIFFGAETRKNAGADKGGVRATRIFLGVLLVFMLAALFFFVSSIMRRKIATSPALPAGGYQAPMEDEEDPFDAAWDAASTQAPYGGGYYSYDPPRG